MKKFDRRDFLSAAKYVPAFAIGAWWLGHSFIYRKLKRLPDSDSSAGDYFDCIVIGAGVSGLTIAREMNTPTDSKQSRKKVVVLEASERVGGRVWTDRSEFSRQVERGAEYVHLPPLETPLWREILKFKLSTRKIPKTNSYLYHQNPDGKGTTRSIESAVISAEHWHPFRAAGLPSVKVDPTLPDSSAAMFINKFVKPDHDVFEEDFKRLIVLGHLGAIDSDLSMRGFQSDKIIEQLTSPNDFYIKKGFGTLVDHLAQDLDIRLSQAVVKITYSKEGVVVETKDGSIFRGRTVAITTSIAVVQSGAIEFSPPLQGAKKESIDSIGMGYHAKVSIEFDTRFWPEDMSMFHRTDQARLMGITYFVPYTENKEAPPMLTAYLVGADEKRALEKYTNEQILENICKDLEAGFPDAGRIDKLVKLKSDGQPSVLYTHWHQNPLVGGGFSFIKYGHANKILPENVRSSYADPRPTPGLFWAGEAAATFTQPASVHGAHSAGARAAIEIQHFLASNGEYLSSTELAGAYNKTWVESISLEGHAPKPDTSRLYENLIDPS